jgi:SAM-dependent methyltransferase
MRAAWQYMETSGGATARGAAMRLDPFRRPWETRTMPRAVPTVAGDPAPRCRLCGEAASVLWRDCRDLEYFVDAHWPFHRCAGCGLVFMHPGPTRRELPALYPADYRNFDPPRNALSAFLVERYHSAHLATALRHLPPGGAFFEVGCADGALLERVRARGHVVGGVEVSRDACERAWAKGLDVVHGTVEELRSDRRWDVVFMSHVIEHVLDPVETIARVRELLEPGGVAYVETPNAGSLDARLWGAGWGLVHYPRHLWLFTRATLRRLLEGAGLIVERERWEINSCGWALSVQAALRRRGVDRSRRPRSAYYPLLLLAFLPLNLLDVVGGGTAFMSVVARRPR